MAYQGISPYIYQQNNLTNVQLIDDISSQFNGSTTTFTMTSGGDTFHAVASRSIFIVLGGIVQEPDVDYTTAGDEITFTTAPVSGLSFAGRKIYGLNKLEGINDGLVTPSKLSLGGPSWDNSGNTTISGYATITGDITQSGDTNNIFINTDTPTVRPTLDLNFERDQRLDSRITFTRSSTATYLGSDGLIKTALAGEPRFEFDTNGNCLGLMIEESRTNYQDYSVDINTGKDFFTGSTLTTNATTAPDGTNTATRITGSGVDEATRLGWNTQGTSNTQYNVFSVFVKTDSGTPILGFYSNTFVAGNVAFNIDLSDGTTNTINNPGSFYSKVVAYPNGWYRVTVMGGVGTGVGGSWNINLVPSLTSARAASSGSNASASYLIWGVQEELASSPFPTSYIPTSGSTVTRSAENVDISYSEFYNNNLSFNYASTFYAEAKVFKANQTNMIVEGYIGSSFKDFSLNTMSGAKMQYVHRYTTTNSYDNDTANNTVTNNVFFKTAMSYTGTNGGLHGTINGRDPVLGEDDLGSTSAGGDTMAIGRRGSNNTLYLNGNLKRLIYYPAKFTSNQLQNLTK